MRCQFKGKRTVQQAVLGQLGIYMQRMKLDFNPKLYAKLTQNVPWEWAFGLVVKMSASFTNGVPGFDICVWLLIPASCLCRRGKAQIFGFLSLKYVGTLTQLLALVSAQPLPKWPFKEIFSEWEVLVYLSNK